MRLRFPDDNIKSMYLPRSTKWSMTRRRKRPNFFAWTLFGLVLLFGYYLNQVYLPSKPNPFEATPTVTRSPESLVTEAEDLFKKGKLPQSIDAYQAAINASPQNPGLYIAIARIQVWAGKYEEAKANAENAILLRPPRENSICQPGRAFSTAETPGRRSCRANPMTACSGNGSPPTRCRRRNHLMTARKRSSGNGSPPVRTGAVI